MTATTIPVNVYRGPRRLMVATHLPGLEPQNIRLELEGERFSIQGMLRGAGQGRRSGYLQQEWMVGPYHREVVLPEAVDAVRANASYDNGVLVAIFPRVAPLGFRYDHDDEGRHRKGAVLPTRRERSASCLKGTTRVKGLNEHP